MLDWLIDRIPWDWLGERIMPMSPGVMGILFSVDEMLFDHIAKSSDLVYKLRSWVEKNSEKSKVVITKFVLDVVSCTTSPFQEKNGLERVRVNIFGKSENGEMYKSGISVVVVMRRVQAKRLKEKGTIEIDVCRLNAT